MRLERLLHGYPFVNDVVKVARLGIMPSWEHRESELQATLKNRMSAADHEVALFRSIAADEADGKFLVVALDVRNIWPDVVCSPFGAVERSGIDPCNEICPIHDLSYPSGSSSDDHFDKTCVSEIPYTSVTLIARRIEHAALKYPGFPIKMLKGDVKGAFRHLMLNG